MDRDYQQLWKSITSGTDEIKAVRVLAEVLADKVGRDFILGLDSEEASLCIGILDCVSCELRLPPFAFQVVSSGHHEVQPPTRREEYFPHHVEETC